MQETLSYISTLLYRDFAAYTSGKLRELGLSYGSMPFILYVGKHPGCTPSELTKALRMDWGHSQRSVMRLAGEGFLTREKTGRTHQLQLTETGEKAFAVTHQVFADWDEARLGGLDREERQLLMDLLERVGKQCREANHD